MIHQTAGSAEGWGAERAVELAREWVRLGHQVTIATATPGDELVDGVVYRRYLGASFEARSAWTRWRSARRFARAVASDTERLAMQGAPNVVIAASDHGLDWFAARRVAARAEALLISDRAELHWLTERQWRRVGWWHPAWWATRRAERAACRQTDLMAVEWAKPHAQLRAQGLSLRKLHLMPPAVAWRHWDHPFNAANDSQSLPGDMLAALDRARRKGYAVVGCAGPLDAGMDVQQLVNAAEQLRQERFAFVVVGEGERRDELIEALRAKQISTAIVFDPIAPSLWSAMYASFDMVYLARRADRLNPLGPSSPALAAAMASGLAVIHTAKAGQDWLGDLDCGLLVDATDARSAARAIRQLNQLGARDRLEMGQRGRAWVRMHQTYALVAERYLTMIVRELTRLADGEDERRTGDPGARTSALSDSQPLQSRWPVAPDLASADFQPSAPAARQSNPARSEEATP